jgi:hypothetical protein
MDSRQARGFHQTDHESGREDRLEPAKFSKRREQVRRGLVHRHPVADYLRCSDLKPWSHDVRSSAVTLNVSPTACPAPIGRPVTPKD